MVSLEVPSEILVDDIRPILHDMEGLECSISQVIIFSPDGEHIDHDATVHDVISEIYGQEDSLQLEPLFIKILDIDEMADHGDNMWKISSRINKLHINPNRRPNYRRKKKSKPLRERVLRKTIANKSSQF
ncbi:hypothetical protein INT44_008900 [Umbelopsis vinacea]|uniref:Uncharacterized protein n=1 Tax=Umbelopsis vinacea TaxID=44442 RepID=A0A8H7Q2L3_9FUNG|nr:hypothetical protein INT44_008900 [Umbelopsis vinacea]